MSKRTRAEFDVEESEEQHLIVVLEAKLADADRKLALYSSFRLDKIREHNAEEAFQAYSDPLTHFELQQLRSSNEKMVVRLVEMQRELAKHSKLPSSSANATDEGKKLKLELAEVRKENNRLEMEAKDLGAFMQYLKDQVKDYRGKHQQLAQENERLKSELQGWQQLQQQQYSMQQEHGEQPAQESYTGGWDFSTSLPPSSAAEEANDNSTNNAAEY